MIWSRSSHKRSDAKRAVDTNGCYGTFHCVGTVETLWARATNVLRSAHDLAGKMNKQSTSYGIYRVRLNSEWSNITEMVACQS